MTANTLFSERGGKAELEEGSTFQPKFDADGLILAAVHDPLPLPGEAVYWSRSRSEIWHKGATSGHVQKLVELRVDCDQDVVLLRVLSGPACHVGYDSCFFRAARIEDGKAVLDVIKDGKAYDPEAVYGKKS